MCRCSLPTDSAPGAPAKPTLRSGRNALTVQFACPTGPIPVAHYLYQLERLDVSPAVTVFTAATSPQATATGTEGTCSFAIAASAIPDDKEDHRVGRFRVQLVRGRAAWAGAAACGSVHAGLVCARGAC